MGLNKVEVCFSPAIYDHFRNDDAIVVVVDILRATTAICAAFMNGASRIIPVGTIEEAKDFKDKGYMVAAERDGIVKDFADFGNSPYNFTTERVGGKEIVYSTTNGTNTIMMASHAYKVLVGAYLNISAIAHWVAEQKRDLVVLCAGWKEKFNLEDSIFAGALAAKVLENPNFHTICDSTHAAMDLWHLAAANPYGYILKAAQKDRLAKNGLDDVIAYCHQSDKTEIIPVLEGDYLIKL